MQRSNVVESLPYEPASRALWPVAAPAGSSEVGDLWRILWCRRALIAATVVVCGLAALVYVLIAPSDYTATAQILIDPRDRQIVTKDVNPDTLASDGGILQVESQSRVIESDAVLLRAVQAAKLADDEDYGARKTGLLGRLINAATGTDEASDPAANENRALRVLRKHLAIKRADKVFVVDVMVTAASGRKAARIADAIAEAYLADQIQSRSESSTRASDALTARLDELRQGVNAAADKVERYKATHDLLGTDKQLISDQQLNDNGTQVNTARAKVAELQARADQLDALRRRGADDGAMPEAIQSTVITQLRASQSELTRHRSDMRTRFGDRHPDLIALDAEIRQTRILIAAELDRLVRSAHADLDRAKKNEQALTGNQDRLKQQTVSSDEASVTLQDLVRDLDARRSIYQTFLARAGETREQSGIDNSNARIISRAIPPVQASWPPRAILLLGAIAGGLGLGAALAFLREYGAPTILSPGQLEGAAHVPVIGVMSGRARDRGVFRFWRRRRAGLATPGDGMAPTLALSRLCGPLRMLKTSPDPCTVLIASARTIARPSLIAASLVSAARRSDVSVLLVEVAPGGAAREDEDDGFLNVLNGECSLRSAITQDGATGIFRLGLGTEVAGAREASGGRRLEHFFKLAGRNFDLIVFNAGSFVDNSRAAPLATAVDHVVFAASRGQTPQKEAAETADAIVASTGRSLSAALLVDHADRL